MKSLFFQNLFSDLFIIHRFVQHFNIIKNDQQHFTNIEANFLENLQSNCLKDYIQQHIQTDNDHIYHQQMANEILTIITTKYPQKYNQSISNRLGSNSTNQYFYHKLFNQRDLVINIFKYVPLCRCEVGHHIKQLASCSLVNSVWLINAFNPRCIESYCISTSNSILSKMSNPRQWHRYSCVEKLELDSYGVHSKTSKNIQKGIKIVDFKQIKTRSLGWCYDTNDDIQGLHSFGECLHAVIDKINQQAENDESYNNNTQLHKSYNKSITIYSIIDHSIALTNSKHDSNWPAHLNLSNFNSIKLSYGTGRIVNLILSKNCKHLKIGGNFSINVSKSCLHKVEYLKLGHGEEDFYDFKPLNVKNHHNNIKGFSTILGKVIF